MNRLVFAIFLFTICFSCSQKKGNNNLHEDSFSEEKLENLGITNQNYLSSASKRALQWPDLGNEWFIEFKTYDLKGDLAYEEGVVRRDPSSILNIEGKYFVWYSKSMGPTQGFGGDIETDKVFPWDRCDIWYATSEDGWTWKEEGLAVQRGEKGAYDDRTVFTGEVLEWKGTY